MGNVIVLDELTACKIAAGEVIERPASVVKELAENSLDAGATDIRTEIVSGGIKMIKITDNGCGFMEDDALIAFDKHATSKIRSADDLDTVNTLGFRGEALASIAAVSEVTLVSKTKDANSGVTVRIKGGNPEYCKPCGCNFGTSITVRDLFYNTPARYKFLKKDSTEAGYVTEVIEKMAMGRPDVAFSLDINGKTVLRTPGNGDLQSAIYSIFGKEVANSLLKVDYTSPDGKTVISGFVGTSGAVYKTRARQYFYVNGRCVKNKFLSVSLDEAVKTSVMKGCFPFALLKIQLSASNLDVNVHPMKTEVRFSDENAMFSYVYTAVKNVFTGDTSVSLKSDYEEIPQEKTVVSEPETPFKKYSDFGGTDFSKKETVMSAGDNKEAIREFLEAIKDTRKETVKPEPAPAPGPTLINMSHDNNTKTEDASIFQDAKIVGQIFDTYILVEKEKDLYIIDQHAAHERLMYEDIKYIIETKKFSTQMMLTPLALNLSKSEYAIICDNFSYFENMGFELENFGGDTILVRAIPSILTESDISAFVAEGIACINEGTDKKFFSDKAIYTMACKAAVKGNRRLDYSEIESLLKRLSSLSGPATCPHGRPFYIKESKNDFDRKFKRIL